MAANRRGASDGDDSTDDDDPAADAPECIGAEPSTDGTLRGRWVPLGVGTLVAALVVVAFGWLDGRDTDPGPEVSGAVEERQGVAAAGGTPDPDPDPVDGAGAEEVRRGETGADELPQREPPPGAVAWDDGRLGDGPMVMADAGFVDFRVDGERLELTDVAAEPGWSLEVQETDGSLTVELARAHRRHTIEVTREGGELVVDTVVELRPAPSGIYRIGPSGSVRVAVTGAGFRLSDHVVADGWLVEDTTTTTAGRVELVVRRGEVTWRLTGSRVGGEPVLRIRSTVAGRYP